MSSGIVHKKACVILSSALAGTALLTGRGELFISAAGALTGVLVSPDQDVDAGNISNTIVKKKVGWFGEKLWRWFWSGYSGSFKHGRFASHFPVFGTFVRLFYIFFFTILPFYALYFLILHSWGYKQWLMEELYYWVAMFLNPYWFFGLAGADTVHYFLDALTKETK